MQQQTINLWLICVLIRQQNMSGKTLYILLFCESFYDILSNDMTLFLLRLVDVPGSDNWQIELIFNSV